MSDHTPRDLARFIDHTLLRPEATGEAIDRLCDEALAHRFAAVCVNPVWVRRAAERLRGSEVAVASVVAFPLGASTREVKEREARRALEDGASEIDMVIDIGALKEGDDGAVEKEIAAVAGACRQRGALLKVILETALLSDEEKRRGCRLAERAGAHFVKTSTGFGPGGATVADVRLMREALGAEMEIKAAGGIKTAAQVDELLAAGASRIGASAGVEIVTGTPEAPRA